MKEPPEALIVRRGTVLYLVVLVVVVSLGLLALRVAGRRGTPRRSLSATALHAAALIALIRLTLFGGGLALFTGHPDWRQVAGYALLTLNAVGELALAAALSNGRPGPPLLVAGLILLTSLALGFVWAWLRFRSPFGGAALPAHAAGGRFSSKERRIVSKRSSRRS